MNQISYQKISLFDAPEDSIIVHGCNAQGMWGSGIAKTFAEKYPTSYKEYSEFCEQYKNRAGIAGLSQFHISEPHWVGWLITSKNYGGKKDDPETIKVQTTLALVDFLSQIHGRKRIYSNKFNSGLFAVPWEDTQRILKIVLNNYPNIDWIVCTPDSKEVK